MELTNSKRKYYDLISNIVNFNKISHAYMIEVDNYDNDFSYILDFVKMILCSKSVKSINDGSCIDCNICSQINNNAYVDLKIIEPEGNVIKKKQLIELQEEYQNKSLLNNKRIYIIKEAEKLNDSSANTILKFLEEPEDDIIAILVTTNRYKVIETILSRCQILSIQDNNDFGDIDDNVIDLLSFIVRKNDLFINYNMLYNEILPDKVVAKEILSLVENIFISYLNYVSNNDFVCDSRVIKLLSKVDMMEIVNYIAVIEDEIKKLDYNVNYKLWLDCLFVRLIGG